VSCRWSCRVVSSDKEEHDHRSEPRPHRRPPFAILGRQVASPPHIHSPSHLTTLGANWPDDFSNWLIGVSSAAATSRAQTASWKPPGSPPSTGKSLTPPPQGCVLYAVACVADADQRPKQRAVEGGVSHEPDEEEYERETRDYPTPPSTPPASTSSYAPQRGQKRGFDSAVSSDTGATSRCVRHAILLPFITPTSLNVCRAVCVVCCVCRGVCVCVLWCVVCVCVCVLCLLCCVCRGAVACSPNRAGDLCYKCNETGHWASQCPNKKARTEPVPPPGSMPAVAVLFIYLFIYIGGLVVRLAATSPISRPPMARCAATTNRPRSVPCARRDPTKVRTHAHSTPPHARTALTCAHAPYVRSSSQADSSTRAHSRESPNANSSSGSTSRRASLPPLAAPPLPPPVHPPSPSRVPCVSCCVCRVCGESHRTNASHTP
jgi:hypothetical protein